MAEEVVGAIASAVTAVVADRAVSTLLDNVNWQAAAGEKLRRLELLLIRIHSAVEVSEKHAIESASLLQWQQKLREAASHGDEVLLSFRQRGTDEAAAHRQSSGDHQHAHAGSSSSSACTALFFTRSAVSSMARRVRTAAAALLAGDEDTRKLDGAVEALEKASENIQEFIALLQLEASPKLKRIRRAEKYYKKAAKRAVGVRLDADKDADAISERNVHGVWCPKREPGKGMFAPRGSLKFGLAMEMGSISDDDPLPVETAECPELAKRLRGALARASVSVEMAERRDIRELEWLARWVDVLREARQHGYGVLEDIDAVGRDLGMDQLRSFVLTVETLVGMEYLGQLVRLCPKNKPCT